MKISFHDMYQAKREISHHLHDHRQKNNSDKPSYHHQCLFINGNAIIIIIIIIINNNNDNNNNNNTLKVIYSSKLHNYQYSMWSSVRDFSEQKEKRGKN